MIRVSRHPQNLQKKITEHQNIVHRPGWMRYQR